MQFPKYNLYFFTKVPKIFQLKAVRKLDYYRAITLS